MLWPQCIESFRVYAWLLGNTYVYAVYTARICRSRPNMFGISGYSQFP